MMSTKQQKVGALSAASKALCNLADAYNDGTELAIDGLGMDVTELAAAFLAARDQAQSSSRSYADNVKSLVAEIRRSLEGVEGFTFHGATNTGGNCKALSITDDITGRELLITNGDAGLPFTDDSDALVFGYCKRGEIEGYLEMLTGLADDMELVGILIDQWMTGTPTINQEA